MRIICILLSCVILTVPSFSFAKRSTKILRGGQGFLFPDHNSFSNPGQFAISHGAAFEANYNRVDGTNVQTFTPSFVLGKGKFGIGAYGSREGTDLGSSDRTLDDVGVGLGFALAKSRLTIGAKYQKYIDIGQNSDGMASLTITMNGPKRKGPAVGLGVDTTISAAGGDSQAILFGFGYSFRSNRSIEVNARLRDISNTSDYEGGAYFNFGSQYLYFGGGYFYRNISSNHLAMVRLGFIIGRYIDISLQGSNVLESGGALEYGATLRASF